VRAGVSVTVLLALGLAAPRVRAGAATDTDLALALLDQAPGAGVVVFAQPRPPAATPLTLAIEVKAPLARLRAMLADPDAYRRAVPWFVRADVREQRPATPPYTGPLRRLAWELEVPLWNLEGELWLRPTAEGAELELVSGDMAPGRYALRALAREGRALLVIEGRANVRNANFMTRRLAARHALAEPAMTATATWVLLRALALEAERPGPRPLPARTPRATIAAPDPDRMDGAPLAAALARLRGANERRGPAGGPAAAIVRWRPDGRLDHVIVAAALPAEAAAVRGHLAQPEAWRVLPGWKKIGATALPPAAGAPTERRVRWTVDSTMPFVDFDSIWEVRPGPPLRARAVDDDWTGATLRWDVVSASGDAGGAGAGGRAGGGAGSVAALSFHGHVERTGYVPRRLIEAEPLIEHGLSLGLAYVNALSLLQSVPGAR
jgi:hypothetical protein